MQIFRKKTTSAIPVYQEPKKTIHIFPFGLVLRDVSFVFDKDEEVLIKSQISGTLKVNKVFVDTEGSVTGSIKCDVFDSRGHVEADVEANTVVLRPNSYFKGNLTCHKIVIVPSKTDSDVSAMIEGKITCSPVIKLTEDQVDQEFLGIPEYKAV